MLVVDDHALFREGLDSVLDARMPSAQLEHARDRREAERALDERGPFDLVLLDLDLGRDDGLRVLREWMARAAMPPIVILSAAGDPARMREALALGARGFVPKLVTGAVLVGALELVLAGGTYVPPELLAASEAGATTGPRRVGDPEPLTPRQLDVLTLLAEGCPNKDIARRLDMADGTVRTHINAIFRALDAANRTQAVMRARQLGWI